MLWTKARLLRSIRTSTAVAAMSLLGQPATRSQIDDQTFVKLIAETQQIRQSGTTLRLVWWLPNQLLRQAVRAQGGDSSVESMVEVLSSYTVILAAEGEQGPLGGMTWTPAEEVRSALRLVDLQGREYPPFNSSALNPNLQILSAILPAALRTTIPPMGENLNVVFFPAESEDGKPIVNPWTEGSFSVRFFEEQFSWRLPLGSLMLVRASVEQGDAAAQHDLGRMYERGLGVPQDYHEALKWCQMAAEQGHPEGQYRLGVMYVNGRGVLRDYEEAVRWYRFAAEQGHAVAQNSLGVRYASGQGVPQDYQEAVKWYRMAAEQGYAVAQNNLGLRYVRGQGVHQDYQEAFKWYRMAAEQGHAGAQVNLGVMYARGQGVPQDYQEAVKWYRMAAEQGYAQAQYNLAAMYANGRGVVEDYIQAYKWWNLAALGGHTPATVFRYAVAAKMTAEEIAEAQRLAGEWEPSSPSTR